MKLGIQFYVTGYTIDPATLGKAVEDAGFESFWVPEHAVLPADPTIPFAVTGGPIPRLYGEMADPFVTLAYVGAATTTLKLGTGVCVIPERHPAMTAKLVSTLDRFSNGRLLFGIGAGWMREEIEVFGVDFDTRWGFTREAIAAMKELWTHGKASYHGKYVNFPELIVDPLPAQRPHPPIIFGSMPTEVAFKRIAKWGDGWYGTVVSPDEIRHARNAITVECEKIGRDPAEIEISACVWEADPALRAEYEDAGADRLIVMLYNHPGTPVSPDRWLEVNAAACEKAPPTRDETLSALDKIVQRAKL